MHKVLSVCLIGITHFLILDMHTEPPKIFQGLCDKHIVTTVHSFQKFIAELDALSLFSCVNYLLKRAEVGGLFVPVVRQQFWTCSLPMVLIDVGSRCLSREGISSRC